MKYPIEGACQCGQLTYKLFAAPKMVVACHCTECQKLATAPFSVTAMVDSNEIEFEGEIKQWSRSSASGNTNTGAFCPDCGNRIYQINPAAPEIIKLKLKPINLQDDSLFEPKVHVWVSEKLSWYQLPEGVKTFDKQAK